MNIHISLAAEEVFRVFGFPVTNSMLSGVVASVLAAGLMIFTARRLALYPGRGVTNTIDAVSEALIDLIAGITNNRAQAIRFFPVLATFFLFILLNNWLGLLPGFGSITLGGVPLFRGATADLNTTLALAIISVLVTHVYAFRELGFKTHVKKYFSWNPILLFVGLLELVSDLSKVMSFSFRLFGNIFAGEVLLVVLSYLMPLVAPLPFFLLEIFVGLVQALVFTMLSLVFLTIAVSHHASHGETAVVGGLEAKQV